ncbi:hypothetical protein [Arthrobacter woluwensis]|uniref:Head-to-tail stopper n=2 Tax=Arthrobacter woluwensis TaxID=156980 RepID=A0A1H4WUH3_9MICC|nr:hypothetical protein [Arthrobacter woluwensis]SEC54890.1 hypothetical protein SAMN04489745_3150 [Arthrobacter woluwensis]SEC91091.1 hypothetical protein SAMN04489745_3491 [Arthrobacter woluwensis]SEC93727.1 hypothetical protein SAMN04489745_3512 [Arthrobacter woluwensis]SEC96875.1 hypothetical protein SAMN04489745_3581 [Arthrobacter woluwensis]
MKFPSPYTVGHQERIAGGEDPMGDPLPEHWEDRPDQKVMGWATPGSDVEIRPTGSGVDRDLDLYSPTGFTKPQDKVIIDGVEFFAVGWPEDYNHGPWRWAPGYRINLKRVEG